MSKAYNGMLATGLPGVAWRKSHRSTATGECVEIARLPAGEVAVRNSRHPLGTVLIYTRAEISAFVRGVKDGEFDDLLALPAVLSRPVIPALPVAISGRTRVSSPLRRTDSHGACTEKHSYRCVTSFTPVSPVADCTAHPRCRRADDQPDRCGC
jgi:hypothetical protein